MSLRTPLAVLATVALALSLAAAPAAARRAKAAKSAKPATTASAPADTLAGKHRVIAYYFHGRARCPNCMKIESWSREAIETAYAKELADGRLAWQVVDVEEEGNRHFAEDYQLYTKSLVLVDQVGGRQTRWKNCAKVWEFLTSKERFLAYVRGEVAGYLKGTP